MKSVNELGISPMPWKWSDGFVTYDDGYVAFSAGLCIGIDEQENANGIMLAASPELYDMCHNLLMVIDKYRGVERVDISCEECLAIIDNAKRILAKAAGEEVK